MSRVEAELPKWISFKTIELVSFTTLMKNFSLFHFILMLEQTQLPSCGDHDLLSVHEI